MRNSDVTRCLLVALLMSAGLCGNLVAQDPDVVIENGIIHDGTGAAPVVGYVALRDGVISEIGTGPAPEGRRKIDATGLIVAPGFIDLHTHSDSAFRSSDPDLRRAVCFLMQGCTTSVTGNCGGGALKVGEYYQTIEENGAGTNVIHLLPYGAVRAKVIGSIDRRATADEIETIRKMAHQAMNEGAWGMSTGLIYVPGAYADTAELIEVAKVIGQHGGIYASHIRGEDERLLGAVHEAIEIGRQAGLPTHISHIKAMRKPQWGTLKLATDLIEQARARGQKVTADQYPYIASSTGLFPTVVPVWAQSGGRKKLVARLDDPEVAPALRKEIQQKLDSMDGGRQLLIVSFKSRPEWTGKNLEQIADAEGKPVLEVVEYMLREGGASIVNFGMSEEDVRHAMTLPWVATASDGTARLPGEDRPHPRSYGTFPRKIGHYAIREQVIPLEAAIASCTGLPAQILGLNDRGLLKAGLAADVVVFNPKTFIDNATFENPHQLASGMEYVFVNGTLAVDQGKPTDALAGRPLRRVSTSDSPAHQP